MAKIVEYSSKSTALRGIERAGIKDKAQAASMIAQLENGKWGFDEDAVLLALGVNPELSEEDQHLQFETGHVNCPHCGIHLSNGVTDFEGMVDTHGSEKAAYAVMRHEWMCLGCNGEWGAEIPAPKGAKGRKQSTRVYTNRSEVEGAVAFCHQLFAELPAETRRKDAIQAAVDKGVAFYTARTQYQKWFKARSK